MRRVFKSVVGESLGVVRARVRAFHVETTWFRLIGVLGLLVSVIYGCSERSCEETRTCAGDGTVESATGANRPEGIEPSSEVASGLSTCPASEHLCNGICVANDDVVSCGVSCSPCDLPLDGLATCDGTRCGGVCASDKKLCAGACIDRAAECTRTCPEGTHECNGLCPSDQSVNACGSSCDPCPVPSGAAQATCDGEACSFLCSPGYHRCGDSCRRDTDVSACGDTCTPCPDYENGFPACNDGTCTIWCEPGFHVCSDTCVDSASPLNCGTSCQPCTSPVGGEATCLGGECGAACPENQKLCAGTCIDQGATCDLECSDGTHDCDGLCVPDSSTTKCGADCVTCRVAIGVTDAVCVDGECGIAGCRMGFHQCDNECFVDDEPSQCGVDCIACPGDAIDPDATPICRDGQCTVSCSQQFHLCDDGACHPNDDITACGPSCIVCEVPLGGSVTCNGSACIPACPDTAPKLCLGECVAQNVACNGECPLGSHACGGFCVADDDTATCGTSCEACADPVNGDPTCVVDDSALLVCGIACASGFHDCDGETCESDTNPGACGETCETCPQPPSVNGGAVGAAVCVDGACDVTCNAGYHQCGDTTTCAADGDANACGPDCVACSGASPVCYQDSCRACDPTSTLTQRCNGSIPQVCSATGAWVDRTPLQPLCNDPEAVCNASTGICSCGTGFHDCGGACIANADASQCGPTCTACVAGQRCDGTACVCDPTSCPNGCCSGNRCITTTRTALLCGAGGAACTPCDANEVCSTTTGLCSCASTFHDCSGTCASNTDATQCGTACTRCPGPTAGTGSAVCASNACGISCASGNPPCGSQCCGGATPVCSGTSCVACAAGTTSRCDVLVTGLQGPCASRVITCTNGAWPTAQCAAGARNCASTADNDCNGVADSSECACVAGATQACNTHPGLDGIGSCRAGTQTCVASGSTAAFGTCTGSVGPATESCGNNVDDDCDGTVDDGCQPACSVGAEACPGQDCRDLQAQGVTLSGVYWIDPTGNDPFQVYCDMQTDGGGWALVWKNHGGARGGEFSTAQLFANAGADLVLPPAIELVSAKHEKAFAHYFELPNREWLRRGMLWDPNGLVVREIALRAQMGATSMADVFASTALCNAMPSAIRVFVNGQDIGATNWVTFRNIGGVPAVFALAHDGMDSSDVGDALKCGETVPSQNLIRTADPIAIGGSLTALRLYGDGSTTLANFFSNSHSSSGTDASRCLFACWGGFVEVGGPDDTGYYDAYVWAVR